MITGDAIGENTEIMQRRNTVETQYFVSPTVNVPETQGIASLRYKYNLHPSNYCTIFAVLQVEYDNSILAACALLILGKVAWLI
jgi:hypothetical protein